MRPHCSSALSIAAVLLVAAACSLDSFRSSELPETMPDDVVFRYSENGGMAPLWKYLKIENDELTVEEKKMNEKRPVIRYTVVSLDEQSALYDVFRENKFDLIENYKPDDITYDAGGDSLSIRAGKRSHGASSGDNSPMSSAHSSRYRAAVRAFFELAKSKGADLKVFPKNAVVVNFEARKHKEIASGAKQADLGFASAARVVAAVKNALKKGGHEDLASTGKYRLELVPFMKAKNLSVYVMGTCDSSPEDPIISSVPPPVCSFTLLADPLTGTYRAFEFKSHAPSFEG